MYDFLVQNSLYIVLIIVLSVWVGIYLYLMRLEGRIKQLEEQLKQ